MKKILSALFLLFVVLSIKHGLAFGGVASLLTASLGYVLWNRITLLLTLREYANEYENIYVVGNHPRTGERVELPEDIDPFVVFSDYDKVFKTIDEQKQILSMSKNAFFIDEALTDKQRLQVLPIIFQDGQFVNETFDEFRQRAIEEIKIDRAKRHSMLKQVDPVWYHKFSNNQKGINWSK